jgi:tRNA/tmRNA/rRNA uracil-C5-methylase (TrmA/RlmC/RlmD family)
VIGVDSPSEVEEAEMTSELNKIYNASFIVGSSAEVVNKLNSARDLHNKNRMTYSIINANTNMGRGMQKTIFDYELLMLLVLLMINSQ